MKKHICMIAYAVYSHDARIRREAEALASTQDYKVLVLSLKEAASPRKYFLNGVEVIELDISKYRGDSNIRYFLSYLNLMISAFFVCDRMLFRNSLDIVHIHNMPNFLIFSAIIPRLLGKIIILDIHDTLIETYAAKFEESSKSRILSKLITSILRLEEFISCILARKIICVNHVQREALIKRGISENKILVLLNVPDPSLFGNNERITQQTHTIKNFKLIYHGLVTKRQSLDLAIRAVANLVDIIPGLEFHIVGNGDYLKEFIGLSNHLGIHERVHFGETVPLSDVAMMLREMDLEIIPSRRNIATDLILPVKMLECIALGIPVVAPRLKAIEHYFSDDMVFYFEPDNIESLTNAILNAYTNENMRMKVAENAKSFLKQYGWETHKFDLINLYKNLQ